MSWSCSYFLNYTEFSPKFYSSWTWCQSLIRKKRTQNEIDLSFSFARQVDFKVIASPPTAKEWKWTIVDGNHQASPISQALIIVDISLLTIGSLAGVFGNGRACVLCWKHKDLYKVPHVLFVNLSLYCFLTSPMSLDGRVFVAVISTVLRFTVHALFSFMIVPVVYVCIILNIPTLSLKEISRQDCVTRPLDQRMTRHSVKKITLVCWILVMVLASAAVTFDILGEHPYCHNFDQYDLLNKMRSNNSFISCVLQACLYRWTWRLFL